jgi:hypothetical protein
MKMGVSSRRTLSPPRLSRPLVRACSTRSHAGRRVDLRPAARAGVSNQNPAHGLGRRGEEVPSAVEGLVAHRPYSECLPLCLYRPPARISIAALRPLMAITLPPGWVHAPHRNTPGMGVRGVSRLSHM